MHNKQEMQLFELKFKGSLDKIDSLEREWQDIKVLHQMPSGSTT